MRQSISFIDVSRTQNFEKIQVKIALPKFLLPLQKTDGLQRREANQSGPVIKNEVSVDPKKQKSQHWNQEIVLWCENMKDFWKNGSHLEKRAKRETVRWSYYLYRRLERLTLYELLHKLSLYESFLNFIKVYNFFMKIRSRFF